MDFFRKKKCPGSCVAQNYYRTTDLMGSSWYFEKAEDAGVFP